MLNKFSFFILCLLSFSSFSQKGTIFFETNYNTYSHSSLSSFQKELSDDIDPRIPIKTTDNFPSSIGFTLGYEINKIKTSFFISYNSTGGKISYADYSGVIRLEQPLNSFALGGMYHLKLNNNFKVGFKAFSMFTNLKLNSYTRIGDIESKDILKFNSVDIGVGTSIIYEYPISFFYIRAQLGFDFVLGGNLNFTDIENAHLINKGGQKVKTNWTGFRSGIGISIPIN